MPKPKWFGIFTTRKRAKDREFGRLTPPKPLRHEYISATSCFDTLFEFVSFYFQLFNSL